jgi:hypothetical protein
MKSPWQPIAGKHTPYSALDGIIAACVDETLAKLREQLAAEEWLTPRGVDVAIARARPLVEKQTRDTIVAGWIDCQLCAGSTH